MTSPYNKGLIICAMKKAEAGGYGDYCKSGRNDGKA